MTDDAGPENSFLSMENHEEGASPSGFNGMDLARRAVRFLVGGLVKQGERLFLKFTDAAGERLWKLLEERLTASTGPGAGQPSPVLEKFRNNLNEPEYHAMLTIALSDALKQQKDFRDEVEGLLREAEKPAKPVKQKAKVEGDGGIIIQVGGNVQGNINPEGQPGRKRKPS